MKGNEISQIRNEQLMVKSERKQMIAMNHMYFILMSLENKLRLVIQNIKGMKHI